MFNSWLSKVGKTGFVVFADIPGYKILPPWTILSCLNINQVRQFLKILTIGSCEPVRTSSNTPLPRPTEKPCPALLAGKFFLLLSKTSNCQELQPGNAELLLWGVIEQGVLWSPEAL